MDWKEAIKYWKSITGLEHPTGFLQGPSAKGTRELLKLIKTRYDG
jgi:hypothetical protein